MCAIYSDNQRVREKADRGTVFLHLEDQLNVDGTKVNMAQHLLRSPPNENHPR